MAKELSDLQKAALDLFIEYKRVDDSFITDVGHAFVVAGDAVANVAQQGAQAVANAATDVAGGVQQAAQAIAQVAQNPQIQAAVQQTAEALANVAQAEDDDDGGAVLRATTGTGPVKGGAGISLDDLLWLRYKAR